MERKRILWYIFLSLTSSLDPVEAKSCSKTYSGELLDKLEVLSKVPLYAKQIKSCNSDTVTIGLIELLKVLAKGDVVRTADCCQLMNRFKKLGSKSCIMQQKGTDLINMKVVTSNYISKCITPPFARKCTRPQAFAMKRLLDKARIKNTRLLKDCEDLVQQKLRTTKGLMKFFKSEKVFMRAMKHDSCSSFILDLRERLQNVEACSIGFRRVNLHYITDKGHLIHGSWLRVKNAIAVKKRAKEFIAQVQEKLEKRLADLSYTPFNKSLLQAKKFGGSLSAADQEKLKTMETKEKEVSQVKMQAQEKIDKAQREIAKADAIIKMMKEKLGRVDP